MLYDQLRRVLVLASLGVLVLAGAAVTLRGVLADQRSPDQKPRQATAKPTDDIKELRGTWALLETVTEFRNGLPQPPRQVKLIRVIDGDTMLEASEDGYLKDKYHHCTRLRPG
jgi:hypothetical protein